MFDIINIPFFVLWVSLTLWLILSLSLFKKSTLIKKIALLFKYTFLFIILLFSIIWIIYTIWIKKDRTFEMGIFWARDALIKQIIKRDHKKMLNSTKMGIEATPFWPRIYTWEMVNILSWTEVVIKPDEVKYLDLVINSKETSTIQLNFKNTKLWLNSLEIYNPKGDLFWETYKYIDYLSIYQNYINTSLDYPFTWDFCIQIYFENLLPPFYAWNKKWCYILTLLNTPYSLMNIKISPHKKEEKATLTSYYIKPEN